MQKLVTQRRITSNYSQCMIAVTAALLDMIGGKQIVSARRTGMAGNTTLVSALCHFTGNIIP
ncbi:MAG: hypothetical protein GY761_17835 [Hyphomicrobiales bacterium]|nr:hypothetical protein [Hyphomicrobiales bacterium]